MILLVGVPCWFTVAAVVGCAPSDKKVGRYYERAGKHDDLHLGEAHLVPVSGSALAVCHLVVLERLPGTGMTLNAQVWGCTLVLARGP